MITTSHQYRGRLYRHLRSKIDDRFQQKLIQTVRGIVT